MGVDSAMTSLFRDDLFRDQTILVTGGGTGIGAAISRELASLGATVVVAARQIERLERTAEEMRQSGLRVSCLPVDIREEESVVRLFQRIREDHGQLQGLVNNAGGQFSSPAEAITRKGWHAVVDTNLTGTFLMCREAFLQFFEPAGGAIVNIVAEMWRGFPGMAHTGAARAGVVNLTQSLAVEWASRGVRVNAVAPGVIASEGLTRYPEAVQALLEQIRRDTPAKRFGTEAEVAAAVTFLLSPAAAYITGETLRVDGASSLWRKTWSIPEHSRLPPYEG